MNFIQFSPEAENRQSSLSVYSFILVNYPNGKMAWILSVMIQLYILQNNLRQFEVNKTWQLRSSPIRFSARPDALV